MGTVPFIEFPQAQLHLLSPYPPRSSLRPHPDWFAAHLDQLPPYDVSQGRPCTYFRVEDPPSLEPQGGEDSDGKGSKSTLARDSRGEEARSGLRAWSRGFGGGSACRDDGDKSGRRVILQEVPEPADLPHWCEYSGPTVVDKSVEAANSGC